MFKLQNYCRVATHLKPAFEPPPTLFFDIENQDYMDGWGKYETKLELRCVPVYMCLRYIYICEYVCEKERESVCVICERECVNVYEHF